jgi:protein-disulfide isomerase
MNISRRLTTTFAVIALTGGLLAISSCKPKGGAAGGGGSALSKYEAATDIPMGSKDAKVVLVEYASVTCGHCATFHETVLPTLKEKYITPGKVRYVFREFPTPPINLAVAGHSIARCAGAGKRDDVISTIMRQQQDMAKQAQGPTGTRQFFLTIAASAGMSEAQFEACLKDEALLKTLVDIQEGGSAAGVTGTPTLFINGERLDANPELEAVTKALDAAIAKAG